MTEVEFEQFKDRYQNFEIVDKAITQFNEINFYHVLGLYKANMIYLSTPNELLYDTLRNLGTVGNNLDEDGYLKFINELDIITNSNAEINRKKTLRLI